mmetsp:Transcript_13210/g.49005  ORF Transcript_13210/g.49005 Transcript_13210/m.49005 type:complete len:317 (+) Transcript_13210:1286-2236(+)
MRARVFKAVWSFWKSLGRAGRTAADTIGDTANASGTNMSTCGSVASSGAQLAGTSVAVLMKSLVTPETSTTSPTDASCTSRTVVGPVTKCWPLILMSLQPPPSSSLSRRRTLSPRRSVPENTRPSAASLGLLPLPGSGTNLVKYTKAGPSLRAAAICWAAHSLEVDGAAATLERPVRDLRRLRWPSSGATPWSRIISRRASAAGRSFLMHARKTFFHMLSARASSTFAARSARASLPKIVPSVSTSCVEAALWSRVRWRTTPRARIGESVRRCPSTFRSRRKRSWNAAARSSSGMSAFSSSTNCRSRVGTLTPHPK